MESLAGRQNAQDVRKLQFLEKYFLVGLGVQSGDGSGRGTMLLCRLRSTYFAVKLFVCCQKTFNINECIFTII